MRLTFFFPGDFINEQEDTLLVPPPELDDASALSDISLVDYLDEEIANLGIEGGEIRFWVDGDRHGVKVVYWVTATFSEPHLTLLKQYTMAQMSDGAGESGFHVAIAGNDIWVNPVCDSGDVVHKFFDDGREVLGPNLIALAAWHGELADLVAALESSTARIDEPLQGFTALQLAMMYGHLPAAKLLIQTGADVSSPGTMGGSVIQSAVISQRLTDEQSCEVVQLLVHRGADPREVDAGTNWTLVQYAESRNKPKLAELLKKLS